MRLRQKVLTPVLSLPLSGLPPGPTRTNTAASSQAHTSPRVTPYLAKQRLCICCLPGKLDAVPIPPAPHSQLNPVLDQQPVQPKCGETLTPQAGWQGSDMLDGLLKPISTIFAQSPLEEWGHAGQPLALSQAHHAVFLWATAHCAASNVARSHQCPNSHVVSETRHRKEASRTCLSTHAQAEDTGGGQATLGRLKRLYGLWKLCRGEVKVTASFCCAGRPSTSYRKKAQQLFLSWVYHSSEQKSDNSTTEEARVFNILFIFCVWMYLFIWKHRETLVFSWSRVISKYISERTTSFFA